MMSETESCPRCEREDWDEDEEYCDLCGGYGVVRKADANFYRNSGGEIPVSSSMVEVRS